MSIPYATTTDFALYVDVNALGELGTDTSSDNATSSIVSAALEAASYDVQSYVLRGGVYTSDDLDTLQSDGDKTLKRTVCVLAAEILVARRLGDLPPSLKSMVEKANLTLIDMRDGKRVFGDLATEHSDAMNPTVSFVSSAQRPKMRMTADSDFFAPRITEAS